MSKAKTELDLHYNDDPDYGDGVCLENMDELISRIAEVKSTVKKSISGASPP